MHSQLHALFHGNTRPSEHLQVENPKYKPTAEAAALLEHEFGQSIPEEIWFEFINFLEVRGDVALMETEQAFIDGYRLGARLMLETLGDFLPDYPCRKSSA